MAIHRQYTEAKICKIATGCLLPPEPTDLMWSGGGAGLERLQEPGGAPDEDADEDEFFCRDSFKFGCDSRDFLSVFL